MTGPMHGSSGLSRRLAASVLVEVAIAERGTWGRLSSRIRCAALTSSQPASKTTAEGFPNEGGVAAHISHRNAFQALLVGAKVRNMSAVQCLRCVLWQHSLLSALLG